MTLPGETEIEIEMVRRHIREGWSTLFASARSWRTFLQTATSQRPRQLLTSFEEIQELHRKHLEQLLHSSKEAGV